MPYGKFAAHDMLSADESMCIARNDTLFFKQNPKEYLIMMYVYLMVTLLSGEIRYEQVGVSGQTWQGCVDFANYAAAERRTRDKNTVKVLAYCQVGPIPK